MDEKFRTTSPNTVCFMRSLCDTNEYSSLNLFSGDEKILNVLMKTGCLNLKVTDNENLTPIHVAAINRN